MSLIDRATSEANLASTKLNDQLTTLQNAWENGLPAIAEVPARAASGNIPARPAILAKPAVTAEEFRAGFPTLAQSKVQLILSIAAADDDKVAAIKSAIQALPQS